MCINLLLPFSINTELSGKRVIYIYCLIHFILSQKGIVLSMYLN